MKVAAIFGFGHVLMTRHVMLCWSRDSCTFALPSVSSLASYICIYIYVYVYLPGFLRFCCRSLELSEN